MQLNIEVELLQEIGGKMRRHESLRSKILQEIDQDLKRTTAKQ